MEKIALLGVGNILFWDEGVGVYAARFLEANYAFAPTIDIVDGGTLGMGLLEYLASYDRVIILDTITQETMAGTCYVVPAHALLALPTIKSTAHEVEVVQMLQASMLLEDTAQVTIVGIVPMDICRTEFGLSQPLREAFAHYIDTALEVLATYGITATPRTHTTSLDAIIERAWKGQNF
ncbi:MAG: hypothetical protein KU37_02180 [Sulfuricurvum sp. PC08-66]|nr:MAG: hypothetical protein KU37_02180 [Sulfuricurvum sp. PC08-66]